MPSGGHGRLRNGTARKPLVLRKVQVNRMQSKFYCTLAVSALVFAVPAAAQNPGDIPTEGETTVFDGDWIAVGAGVLYGPSYDGSDDYVITPAPIVQGNVGGIAINPRPAGFALDFIQKPEEGVGFSLGPSVRLRSNRAVKIADPVVEELGKLDRALEIGPTAGITIPKVLHGYDSLAFSVDVRWDVLGAHNGMVVAPSVTYFTPLSRGAAVAVSIDAERGDASFMDYYYSVSPADAAVSGLTQFDAGSGFTRAGISLLGGVDLNGDLTDGGFSLVFMSGYSRMLGDAKRSPFTSERGSADQWMGALGLGYTF